ncbi:hypothetical protein HD598_000406 [Neomicrococcus aestuarii]|uniref:ABC transporter permease n=1 Tax=Neomicrococcus aestuarii TaxID=556325 RepID=A0A7W8TRS4_9MICC|nr:ABC transporter permease [Neomicrococcus aestuarii]MBB5511719.1 hypothetical protein [Neomicrococcus aestuarii]
MTQLDPASEHAAPASTATAEHATESTAREENSGHQKTPLVGKHTSWVHVARTALIAAAVVCIVLLAFAWPSVTSKVQHLPVGAVGSAEQIAQIEALDTNDALELHTVASREEAVSLIQERDLYGTIILGDSPEVLTASASAPAAAATLTQIGTGLRLSLQGAALAQMEAALKASAAGSTLETGSIPSDVAQATNVTITDVVPLAETESRGAGLAVSGLPLATGGMEGGAMISLFVSGTWRRLAAIAGYGILAGLGIAGILQGWFHILQGDFIANAAAITFGTVATAATIVGLNSLIGRLGILVGAIITIFVGNPLSSLQQPLEFLPGLWGSVGQYLVPGANGTLVRDLSYFPAADTSFSLWVPTAWTLLGAILMMVGHFRNQPAVAEI